MECPRCRTELIAGTRFCHSCGTPVSAGCPACGSPIESRFRYCPHCGNRLGPAEGKAAAPHPQGPWHHVPEELAEKIRASGGSMVGERKLVTVLFCDLVGSTAIAEQLDPEEYHELLEEYLAIAFREIYRVEGMVNQLAGDGMMALFGAPLAHEDAPHRAVRAALAIRQELAGLDTRVRAGRDLGLRVRIGINTGPVVVGPVGNDLKMDYSAIGDTTNLAARLQSLAVPGVILMSEATHRLVRGFVQVRAAGPFAVKGKSEPIAAYEVLGLHEAATPIQVAAGRGLTPLVGRREEIAQLVACYKRLHNNQAQVVAIVGEAGSGKSRLLYEFKEQLAGENVVFFEGRCSPLTAAQPYAPVAAMLRQYFGVTADEAAACASAKVAEALGEWDDRLDRLHPFLCRLLSGPVGAAADVPAEELKRATFEAVAQLVMGMSGRAPVVMILEDLHWVDDVSRELLEMAVSQLRNARVMLAVSHRPDYQASWRSAAAFTQLTLSRLSVGEATEMIRAVAGGAPPAELEQFIQVKAEGNPLFIEEITRALFEEGYLVRDGDRVRLSRPVEQILIPDTLQELIAARLDRLGAQGKRAVQVAALLGRQFHRGQLVRVLEGEGVDVEGTLDELERRGVIHRKHVLSRDEYRFGESLTQEVAYESLLHKERRQLHERAGRLLEEIPGELTPERSALLAHHYARSNNREKAVEALLRAGRDAERLPSYRSAARFYAEAWEVAEAMLADGEDGAGRHEQSALQAALGVCRAAVLYGWGDRADAEAAARRGQELARALGDAESLAHLYAFEGIVARSSDPGGFARGLALIEEGLGVARGAGLALAAAGISRALAWGYLLDGRFAPARETIDGVIEELGRLGERDRLSDTYFGTRFIRDAVYLYSDDLTEVLRHAEESYTLAVSANNRTVQSGSAATLAQAHFLRGQYRDAVAWADQGLETAEAIGLARPQAAAVALAARVEVGERVAAERYVELIDEGLREGMNTLVSARVLVGALLAAGELERAERTADLASGRAGGRLQQALAAAARGDVMVRLGPVRWVEAGQSYDRAIVLARAIGARSTLAAALLGAAELATLRGDRERGGQWLEEAMALSSEVGLGHYRARAERLRAHLRSVASAAS